MKWNKISGLIAATFTPMHTDGSLNPAAIEPYIQHLLNLGVKHVFVNGTTGEAQSLTVEERKVVAEAWIKHGRGKLDRIIVHCGTGNLIETKELIKHAAGLGVDAVAVVAPTYFKPATLTDLVDYCADAAKEAPDTPFLYYHIPALTGINFRLTDFFKEAHTKIASLAGAKFTSSDLQDAVSASLLFGSKYDVMIGADGMLLPSLSMGLNAFIGITFNIVGKPCNRLIKAFEGGDLKKAREEQIHVNEFLNLTEGVGSLNSLMSSLKSLVPEYFPTINLGPTRKPIRPLTSAKIAEIKKNLETMNLKNKI